MTEMQEYRRFIKYKFPVGTVIQDPTCSEPYTINKRSVFIIFPRTYDDYNDWGRPKDEKDYVVEFLVQNPGKHTRRHYLDVWFTKGEILEKYQEETPIWIRKDTTKFEYSEEVIKRVKKLYHYTDALKKLEQNSKELLYHVNRYDKFVTIETFVKCHKESEYKEILAAVEKYNEHKELEELVKKEISEFFK